MNVQKILPLVVLFALSACQSTSSSKVDTASSATSNNAGNRGICQQVRGDTSSGGRNVLYRCNGQAVLNSSEAQSVLSGGANVSFSAGGSVIQSNLITRQAANRVGKSDEDTCVRAFINAAKKFQETTAKHGGSRVTNFHSYYDKQPLSGGQYHCEVGTFHGRVVMRGNVAR